MILIVVLVMVPLLALAAYSVAELMLAELEATTLQGQRMQAHALAESGVEAARLFLAQEPTVQRDSGGPYDNPALFREVLVLDGPTPYDRGRFTLLAPRQEAGVYTGVRYGLQDESARFNLHVLLWIDEQVEDGGRQLLLALPGMTEETADAILDWLDEDDEPRQFGAELEYYSSLDPPYAPKNGPLDTIEELLLVRGVTPELLYGGDANRNGVIDPEESELLSALGLDAYYGELDLGWAAYLTLYSQEANVAADGTPRININGNNLEELYTSLLEVFPTEWATFIVAYRLYGPYTGNEAGQSAANVQLDLSRRPRAQLTSVLDLIGVKVRVPQQDRQIVVESPFASEPGALRDYLPELADRLTVHPQQVIVGRININQAPAAVLRGIPGMTEDLVQAILAQRSVEDPDDPPGRASETWLLAEELVSLDEMRQLLPFVTGRGSVYRVQAVGHFDAGGPAARVEAILDATSSPPAQVFWRDLSHLGAGYVPQGVP
jgi:type II secretory pathway component PulK